MAFVTSAQTANNNSIARPGGAVSGTTAIAVFVRDGNGSASNADGFTELADIDQAGPDGQNIAIFYKHLGGSEPSNYTFNSTSGSSSQCVGLLIFSGRNTSGAPVVQTTTNTSANSSPVTASLTGVMAVSGDDVVCALSLDITGPAEVTYAPPGSYTEAVDTTDTSNFWASLGISYRENVSAGATGTLQPVGTIDGGGTAGYTGFVVRIPVAGGGATTSSVQLRTFNPCLVNR
jgi:hypothetical protein